MPTVGEIAQLITAVVLLLTYLQSRKNGKNIEAVHKATNSMKDELVTATAKASLAEGTAAGLQQGRSEEHS